MIGHLTGEIREISGREVLIDVNSVGYEVLCSRGCAELLSVGSQASLVVYTEVKEDTLRLHGFVDRLERQVFALLLRVKGIGVRSASDIISQVDKLELLRIIGTEDRAALGSIRGIGRKTAERIIVELRDRVNEFADSFEGSSAKLSSQHVGTVGAVFVSDALEALKALGFTREIATQALELAQNSKDSAEQFAQFSKERQVGELVRLALKYV